MGHLWKRNGVYYMGFKDRKGKWRQRSSGTRDKSAAQRKLDQVEPLAAYGENKPLSDFLGEYLESRSSGLSERGLGRYEFCKAILVDDHSPLAWLTLQELNVAACTRYITWRLRHGRSKTTVAKEIAWLKAAVDAAAEEGHVSWSLPPSPHTSSWPGVVPRRWRLGVDRVSRPCLSPPQSPSSLPRLPLELEEQVLVLHVRRHRHHLKL